MKVAGLELPAVLAVHPGPWAFSEAELWVRDANSAEVPADDVTFEEAGAFLFSAPDLAAALVDVTQALVDGLEVHAPGVDPLQHVAVQKALAALAKARGEA